MNFSTPMTPFGTSTVLSQPRCLVVLLALCLSFASTVLHAGGDVCRVTPQGSAGNNGASWAQAKTLHDALATPSCSELWIKAGIYTPTSGSDRNARFNVRGGTALYGGFGGTETDREQRDPALHRTVLSGDIGGDDIVDEHGITLDASDIVGLNSHNVVWIDTAGDLPVRFDSLTITAGMTNVTEPVASDKADGRCSGSAFADCARNLLRPQGDESVLGGGGIHCTAWPPGEVCAIQLNKAVLRGNVANQSGAMFCYASDGGHCQVDIEASSFVGNAAHSWGGALGVVGANTEFSSATLDVRTSTWAGNRAQLGGAIVFVPAGTGTEHLNLRQSTIVGSRTPEAAAALMLFGAASVEIDGLFAWDNGEDAFMFAFDTGAIVSRSLLQYGCPLYVNCGSMVWGDPGLLPLHESGATPHVPVAAHSAVVDAMDCSGSPAADQRGVERPQGLRCDVGAFELRQAKVDVEATGGGSVTAVIVPSPMSGSILQCRQNSGSCQAHYDLEASSPELRLLLVPDAGHVVASVKGCGGHIEGLAWVIDALDGDCSLTVHFAEPNHSVGGTVTGLLGSGLSLSLNGGVPLSISDNGLFEFSGLLPAGAEYSVALVTQPTQPTQTCVVFNGSGAITDRHVDNVVVHCGPVNTYTVGGTLSGLGMGESVGVSVNGGAPLTLAANGPYVFPYIFTSGEGYSVAIVQQPEGQYCSLDHDSGVIGSASINDLDISCVVGGTQLQLTLSDSGDYAAYGRTRSYQVTLSNAGPATASNIAVTATFDPSFDTESVQWACLTGAPGASCGDAGTGGFVDSVTLPAGTSAVWILSVPVRSDSNADQATLVIHAEGAPDVSDTNTLVLFRDGLDVPYGELNEEPRD
jgi:uncharacterized repeat protein (TIGR01451 family)